MSNVWQHDPCSFLAALPVVTHLELYNVRVDGTLYVALLAALPATVHLSLVRCSFADLSDVLSLAVSFPLLESLAVSSLWIPQSTKHADLPCPPRLHTVAFDHIASLPADFFHWLTQPNDQSTPIERLSFGISSEQDLRPLAALLSAFGAALCHLHLRVHIEATLSREPHPQFPRSVTRADPAPLQASWTTPRARSPSRPAPPCARSASSSTSASCASPRTAASPRSPRSSRSSRPLRRSPSRSPSRCASTTSTPRTCARSTRNAAFARCRPCASATCARSTGPRSSASSRAGCGNSACWARATALRSRSGSATGVRSSLSGVFFPLWMFLWRSFSQVTSQALLTAAVLRRPVERLAGWKLQIMWQGCNAELFLRAQIGTCRWRTCTRHVFAVLCYGTLAVHTATRGCDE